MLASLNLTRKFEKKKHTATAKQLNCFLVNDFVVTKYPQQGDDVAGKVLGDRDRARLALAHQPLLLRVVGGMQVTLAPRVEREVS